MPILLRFNIYCNIKFHNYLISYAYYSEVSPAVFSVAYSVESVHMNGTVLIRGSFWRFILMRRELVILLYQLKYLLLIRVYKPFATSVTWLFKSVVASKLMQIFWIKW